MTGASDAAGAPRVAARRIRAQILEILRAWRMPEDLAETTTEVMTETDLMGVDSRGIGPEPGSGSGA